LASHQLGRLDAAASRRLEADPSAFDHYLHCEAVVRVIWLSQKLHLGQAPIGVWSISRSLAVSRAGWWYCAPTT
jgi:hypothetical protein